MKQEVFAEILLSKRPSKLITMDTVFPFLAKDNEDGSTVLRTHILTEGNPPAHHVLFQYKNKLVKEYGAEKIGIRGVTIRKAFYGENHFENLDEKTIKSGYIDRTLKEKKVEIKQDGVPYGYILKQSEQKPYYCVRCDGWTIGWHDHSREGNFTILKYGPYDSLQRKLKAFFGRRIK